MPVRNGRHVPWSVIEAEKRAAAAAEAATADEPEPEQPAKRTRRTRKAAEAAIADATGVAVDLTEALPEVLPNIEEDTVETA